jgi:hypothetical protein
MVLPGRHSQRSTALLRKERTLKSRLRGRGGGEQQRERGKAGGDADHQRGLER